MKAIQLLLCSSLISFGLVGCVGLPKQDSAQKINPTTQLTTSEPIIAYFSPDAGEEACSCGSTMDMGYSLTPVENGYYRKLLGRDQDGRFLLQDFYQNSHKKQTDPFWMIEPQGLNSFDSSYTDGDVIAYKENGNIDFKFTVKDQEVVGKAFKYYSNNQIAIENEDIDNGITAQTLWYENGKLAANLKTDEDNQILEINAFDENGTSIDTEDDEKIDTLIQSIFEKAYSD